MQKKFIISNACPPAQKQLFEAINAGLERTGMSADEFDRRFRIQLLAICAGYQTAVTHEFLSSLDTKVRQSLFIEYPRLRGMYAEVTQTVGSNIYGFSILNFLKPITNSKVAFEVLTQLDASEHEILGNVLQQFNSLLGGDIRHFAPEGIQGEKRVIYDEAIRVLGHTPIDDSGVPTRNLLQDLAEGRQVFNQLQQIPLMTFGNRLTYQPTDMRTHILQSIGAVFQDAIGITNQPALSTVLDPISTAANALLSGTDSTLVGMHDRSTQTTHEIAPTPLYTLPSVAATPPPPISDSLVNAAQTADDGGIAYLTTACIDRAKATGQYRLVTHREALQALTEAGASMGDIRHTLVSIPLSHTMDTRSFKILLRGAAATLDDSGQKFKLADGTPLDTDRYYQEAEAEAEKWAAHIRQLSDEVMKELISHPSLRNDGKKISQMTEATKVAMGQFTKLYEQLDPDIKAIALVHGVKFMMDSLREYTSDIHTNPQRNLICLGPDFFSKPDALSLLRYAIAALGVPHTSDMLSTALDDLSREAFIHAEPNLPKRWGNRETGVSTIKIAYNEPQLVRKLLPIGYLKYHLYELQIKKEAHRIRSGLPAPIYKASDTAFTTNPAALTADQHAYFDKLNEIIAQLGARPDQFDAQFRLSADIWLGMAQDKMNDMGSSDLNISNELDLPVAEYMFGAVMPGPLLKPTEEEQRLDKSDEDGNTRYFLANVHNKIKQMPIIVPPEENVLQSYASGVRPMALLATINALRGIKDGQVMSVKNDQIFQHAIDLAIQDIAAKQGLKGDQGLAQKIEVLEALSKRAFLWPEDHTRMEARAKMSAAAEAQQQQEAYHRAKIADETARAAAQQQQLLDAEATRARLAAEARLAEEQRRAAAEASKAVPYVLAASAAVAAKRILETSNEKWAGITNPVRQAEKRQRIFGMQHLQQREMAPLMALFDTKQALQREIADIFFAESTLRRAEYACLGPQVKSSVLAHPGGFTSRASELLIELFTYPTDDLPESKRTQYEQIKSRIWQSPSLVIAALGDDTQLRTLCDIHHKLLPNELSAEEISALEGQRTKLLYAVLEGIGLDVPALEGAQQNQSPVPVVVTIDAQMPTDIHPDLTSGIVEEGFTLAAPPASGPEIIHVADHSYPADPDGSRHKAAIKSAQEALLADVQQHITTARAQGFNLFECRIDVANPNFPILLDFSKRYPDEDKKMRTKHLMEPLKGHADIFHAHQVACTLGDAVDLKIAVQSNVLNVISGEQGKDFYFESPLTTHKTGVVDIAWGAELPVALYNPPAGNIVERTGGICALEIEIPNPYQQPANGPANMLRASFPLGIARKPGTPEARGAIEAEISARQQYILATLRDVQRMRDGLGVRITVTKSDVVQKLQSWIEAQGKEWETPTRVPLKGFEKPTEIHVGEGTNTQKISLAPVKLVRELGGANPSWVMELRFYVGDRDGTTLGEPIRSRDVRLHTADPELAARRALESLKGLRTSITHTQLIPDFLGNLKEHMRKNPSALWRKVGQDEAAQVMIGDQPFQKMLDDMTRYEHDVSVRYEVSTDETGQTILTLRASRSNTCDFARTVFPKPEQLFNGGEPIQLRIPIPKGQEDKISAFANSIHGSVNHFVGERYASVALAEQGDEVRYRRPAPYNAASAGKSLRTEVASSYQATFGIPLPLAEPQSGNGQGWAAKKLKGNGSKPGSPGC